MKKYPSMFGVLAALLLVASFIVPSHLITPSSVEADPAVCAWDTLTPPTTLHPIYKYTDIVDMSVSGSTVAFVVRANALSGISMPGALNTNALVITTNSGISMSTGAWANWRLEWNRLFGTGTSTNNPWSGENVYLVALAPDSPSVIAIVTDAPTGTPGSGPKEVWITTNGGGKWEVTNLSALTIGAAEYIRWIDISVDYGGRRDIAVGTVDGNGGGDVYVLKSTGFTGWIDQGFDAIPVGDFFAGRFSPSYASDAALALVFADTGATYYNVSLRDIDRNLHRAWAFASPVEVRNPASASGASPGTAQLNRADLELPSDYSGAAASLRRAYISLDAYGFKTPAAAEDGIYRIDDTTVYVLMDTTNDTTKSIYSIAYFGTFASGKLLAGERMGYPCEATVPTWFTDAPTVCPIPCWYPALKPTTGAANITGCPTAKTGPGGALVGWRGDGQLAFAATGGLLQLPASTWFGNFANPLLPPRPRDESAFAISRNNGETWNQINLIDTHINNLTDIAPSPDCKTVYLASVSNNTTELALTCDGFDSVWRSSSSADVNAPLPGGLPVGTWWERVLTRVTAASCSANQSNMALLRLVPYCQDETGQIVAWAAYARNRAGTIVLTSGVAMWSPDYGDYWATVMPRNPVQDFCFESKTVLYFLSPTGLVQKMPYTGTAWATTLSDINSWISSAHTIAAYPEGQVIVGAGSLYHGVAYATSFSSNFHTDNPSFTVMTAPGATFARGNVHVAFHPAFKDNKTVFIADNGTTGSTGSVYRNNVAAQKRWVELDMMGTANGAVGCDAPHPMGQYGIVLSFTGEALYSAHTSTNLTIADYGVCRTIDDGTGKFGPLSGLPKPGVAWDCLNVFIHRPLNGVLFSNEPSSLKICGCCTKDTDTTLYAIDNDGYFSTAERKGLPWKFTDCLAKNGPKLLTADKMLIGCDPVSGRAAEVNLCWEQLCVADAYDLEIAKDKDFTLVVVNIANENVCHGLMPVDVTKPCVFFPAGGRTGGDVLIVTFDPVKKNLVTTQAEGSAVGLFGQLECGKTYYWRVKARECATTQWARSPWSEVRSFSVKAGLPVTAPYSGIMPLAPANGATNVAIKNPSFSWAPMGDTTKYEFILAEDAAMTKVVKQDTVSSTAYLYTGNLKYSTSYFWRVRPVEPAPGDWSPVFTFTTASEPAPPPPPEKPAPTPLWVWVVIAIGAILVIVTLVLIFKTRRA